MGRERRPDRGESKREHWFEQPEQNGAERLVSLTGNREGTFEARQPYEAVCLDWFWVLCYHEAEEGGAALQGGVEELSAGTSDCPDTTVLSYFKIELGLFLQHPPALNIFLPTKEV